MNDETYQLRILAIRKRRQWNDYVFSENGRAPERAGLVALSRAVYLLATRFVMRPEWPGHDVSEETKRGWELQWYFEYLQALEELTPRLQAAVRSGAIIPRGLTRAPVDNVKIRQWLTLDVTAVLSATNKTFWAKAEGGTNSFGWPDDLALLNASENIDSLNAKNSPVWPDASVMPYGIFVTVGELTAWSESEGITAPGEVAGMMRNRDEPETPAPPGTPESDAPPATVAEPTDHVTDDDSAIADLFDPVKPAQLEAMFPDADKWKGYAERADRNGLKEAAKCERGLFNPYHAAVWWLREKGPKGWDMGRCLRKLANNLPARSMDSKHLLTDDE